MANIDLGNLTRYDGKIKEYTEDKYLSKNTANWQMTEKAGAVACYPVPDTDLDPVVDFMFTDTPPVEGENGPANPSIITGVDSVMVMKTGKNLLEIDTMYVIPDRGITASINEDGSIHVEGTTDALPGLIDFGLHDDSGNKRLPYWMKIGKTYTASLLSSQNTPYMGIYISNSLSSWGYENHVSSNSINSFTVTSDKKRALIRLIIPKNTTCNFNAYVQIEEGSIATSFEPYVNVNYIMNLNNTYYGGKINLATGELTVTHRGVVFNGTEEFSLVTYGTYYQYRLNIANYQAPGGDALIPVVGTEKCTHFTIQNTTNLSSQHAIAYGARIDFFVTQQSVETFKAWLASEYNADHPVTIVYPLANPYTVQLDPAQIKSLMALDKNTPRLNTLYTDADSIQVGYQKHPARTAYELENAILALGGGE